MRTYDDTYGAIELTGVTAKLVQPQDKYQIGWGANDNPNDILEIGKEYEVEKFKVCSSHSKIYLKDFPDKRFNSVNFELSEDVWERGLQAYNERMKGVYQ